VAFLAFLVSWRHRAVAPCRGQAARTLLLLRCLHWAGEASDCFDALRKVWLRSVQHWR